MRAGTIALSDVLAIIDRLAPRSLPTPTPYYRLTERQVRILAFIAAYVDREGYSPSSREIVAACGISSTSVVSYNLQNLVRDGYLRTGGPAKKRAIRMTQAGRDYLAWMKEQEP